ncbi:MAG: conserved membrane protein of unknown function [Promethearchaeota archaeon]|nr:MAG: conserved membrane protein of unknown function [Candidatus Lokiarchaeota archaeon]
MEKTENRANEAEDQYTLTKKERIAYSLANLPHTILAGIFGLTYVNYFWDDLKILPILFTIGQVVYLIINSFNDFYLGRLSDKTDHKKWGSRRLVYIKWGGVLWAFVFFSLWFPWSYTNQVIIFIHFLVSICAFDMLLTLVILVWIALMPELTENIDERNQMALNNQYFLIIGALPVLISFVVFEMGLVSFHIYTGICAVLSAGLYYFVASKLKEKPELYEDQVEVSIIEALKEVVPNKSFITLTIFRTFRQINISLGLSFVFAYFLIFGVDIWMASLLYYLLSTVVTLIGFIIYKKLSLRYEMRSLMIWGILFQICLNVIAFFVLLPRELEPLVWLFLTANFIIQGYVLFDFPLLSLVTDEDEFENRSRREGLILGTNAFILKIGESIGPIIGTNVLLLFGFIQGASTQASMAIVGIKFLLFIIQSIFIAIGGISLYFFPLHGERLKHVRSKLSEIHKEKTKKYEAKL